MGRTDGRTDGRMDGQGDDYMLPRNFSGSITTVLMMIKIMIMVKPIILVFSG